MRYAVIMAGGAGTRLWPLSRQGQPKQLLKLFDGKSLLQLAFERARRLLDADHILVCTGAAYADEVRAQLPELSDDGLLGEPVGRDSLNAVAWPAAVLAKRDPEAVVATLTADQLIRPVKKFLAALEEGFQVAEKRPSSLVTFGVVPTSPHTGYGYLAKGQSIAGFEHTAKVNQFTEKPDAETAAEYLASGDYWWNAGMFVWRASTLLDQLKALLPATYQAVRELADHPERLKDIYPTLFKTSVDYAIMEPVSQGKTDAEVVAVSLKVDWLDVGSYQSLFEALHAEGGDAGFGNVVAQDSSGNLLINTADDGVLAVIGLENCVVVRTGEVTLVAPLSASQQIKGLVSEVSNKLGAEFA